jgi:hypothetical protein
MAASSSSSAAERAAVIRSMMDDLGSRCPARGDAGFAGCRCAELMEDDDPCGASCPWCEKQKAAAAGGPDLSQVPRRYRHNPEAYFAMVRAMRALRAERVERAERAAAPVLAAAPAPSRYDLAKERRRAAFEAGAERRASLRSAARARARAVAAPPAPVLAAPPAPAPAPSRFAADAAVIRAKMEAQEAAVGVLAKVAAAREVFCSLFAFPAMVSSSSRFRATALAKMAELEVKEDAAELRPLFEEVRAFLERLKTRADYVA